MGHMASTVRPLPTMTIVWHFKRTMLCMLFHGLIKCAFACQKVYHTILYTQYIIMLCMCIVQRNLGQVMISGIQACMCMQYFVIIDRAFVAFCYVTGMCRMIKNNVVNSSFRSSVALIRRLWMQVLLHLCRLGFTS